MTLTHDTENVFTCGASVAPVVDWTLYDTYYTERYMGLNTEEDNFEGYKRASALNNVSMLRNKRYFLLHGTHDDNVHYQNSMLLSATLERQDILFRQQAYPDHSQPSLAFTMGSGSFQAPHSSKPTVGLSRFLSG